MLIEGGVLAGVAGAVAITANPEPAAEAATSAAEWVAGLLQTDPDAIVAGAQSAASGGIPPWLAFLMITMVALRRSLNAGFRATIYYIEDRARAMNNLPPRDREDD